MEIINSITNIFINMSNNNLINKENGNISKVQEEIKRLNDDVKVLKKLYVILDIFHNIPPKDVAEKHQVGIATVYRWIKEWNEGGIENLKRKKRNWWKTKINKRTIYNFR